MYRAQNQNKNGTGAMTTAINEAFIGRWHENCYLVGGTLADQKTGTKNWKSEYKNSRRQGK